MDFKFKMGDLVRVNEKYGIFQVVKPICFKDQSPNNCLKYYIRQIFDKNDELNVQPAILCHESWMDLLSQNTKLYANVVCLIDFVSGVCLSGEATRGPRKRKAVLG